MVTHTKKFEFKGKRQFNLGDLRWALDGVPDDAMINIYHVDPPKDYMDSNTIFEAKWLTR